MRRPKTFAASICVLGSRNNKNIYDSEKIGAKIFDLFTHMNTSQLNEWEKRLNKIVPTDELQIRHLGSHPEGEAP